MSALCEKCGANLGLVGVAHRCIPRAEPVEKPRKRRTMTPEQREARNAYMREYMRKRRKADVRP